MEKRYNIMYLENGIKTFSIKYPKHTNTNAVIIYYHYFAIVTQCYGLICISVTDFLRGHIWIFMGYYEFLWAVMNFCGPL